MNNPRIKDIDKSLKQLAKDMCGKESNLSKIEGNDNFLINDKVYDISFKIEEILDLPVNSRFSKSGKLMTFKNFKLGEDAIKTRFMSYDKSNEKFVKEQRELIKRDLDLLKNIDKKSVEYHEEENPSLYALSNLQNKFEEQVKADNKKYSELIKDPSEYEPNPNFCMNPKYLLVSMEPSKNPEEKLPKGILNFLNSIDDFILHYCAFYYLCGGNFDYNITDISKGAMPVEIARKLPGRYEDWFNLLKDEIEIYNNPKIIAIGKSEAGMFLKNKDLVEDKNILYHFSNGGVRVHVQNYYNKNLKEKYPLDSAPTMKELSEFTKKILNYNDYFLNEDKILNKMSRELHDQEKMLFLYYKSKFLEIKNNYIISRQDL